MAYQQAGHILTPAQQAQYYDLRRKKGAAAAEAFKSGITGGAGGNAAIVNPDNNATVNQVSQGQRDIANAGGDLALHNLMGSSLGNAFNPTLTDRPNTGNLETDRSRIEGQVYDRLTRNLDTDYQAAHEQTAQSLLNRGIPFSADPNSRYQQELGRQEQNYLGAKTDARQRATEIGGTEYQRNFDIGEQLRQNQFNEQAGTRNQQLGEAGGLSNLGVPGTVAFEQLSDVDKERALKKWLAQLQASTAVKVAGIN